MKIEEAKKNLDKIITKGRIHLYKPIHIAEVLYRDRVAKDIKLDKLESYRTQSRKWRDIVCLNLLGRTSTSSMRYQDDVFNTNAVPPNALAALGVENRNKNGIVEKYIYDKFLDRYKQMSSALEYVTNTPSKLFKLKDFIDLFWKEPGLKRSIDKIYEIIVYALFNVLVDELGVTIEVSYDKNQIELLKEFEDFAKKVIRIDSTKYSNIASARINRVGVTNAADRGLDMWANFGPAIQIKHLSLNEELAEEIVTSISSDRIVIVCKDSEEKVILSLLNQLGWKAKIQSIIIESELINWYNKALRGLFAKRIGSKLMKLLAQEIMKEFPSSDAKEFRKFYRERNYHELKNNFWK